MACGTEFGETHGSSLILDGLVIAFILTRESDLSIRYLFSRAWPHAFGCLWAVACTTHRHKQAQGAELAQSRAKADGCLTARAYGRQTASLPLQSNCLSESRKPALSWISSGNSNFSPLYSLKLPGTLSACGSAQLSTENVTIKHIFEL